jgi:hypothetical protein
MWYYSVNNQPVGPVDEDYLRNLVRSGTLSPDTYVWKEGLAEWVALGNSGVLSAPNSPAAAWQQPYPQEQQFQPTQQYPAYSQPQQPYQPVQAAQDHLRIKPSSLTGLYIAWIVVYGVAFVLGRVSFLSTTAQNVTRISVLTNLLGLVAAILLLVFISRCWSVVQDGKASTTPGKAIGYLFIPAYNFYWLFRAYHGLSGDLNRFIDRHFNIAGGVQPKKSIPAFSLVFCILLLVNLVYSIVFQAMVTNGAFRYMSVAKGNAVVNLVIAILYTAFTVLMCTDYLITSRRILTEIQKQ